MREPAWSWEIYDKQFGNGQASPRPSPDAPAETVVPAGASAPTSEYTEYGRHHVILPGALAERLRPYAHGRGMTIGSLVIALVEIELEGELIDLTLDGEEAAREFVSAAETIVPERFA